MSRTTPERQRFELEQLAQGRRPFSTKSLVYDTTSYREIESRLARAAGLFNKAFHAVAFIRARKTISADERNAVKTTAVAFRKGIVKLAALTRRDSKSQRHRETTAPQGFKWKIPRAWAARDFNRLSISFVLGRLNTAKSFIDKCVRDLTNQPGRVVPSTSQKEGLCRKIAEVKAQVDELVSRLD